MNSLKEKKTSRKSGIPPELIERARSGEQEAYSELYRLTSPTLYRTIRSMVRDEDLAWDIQQNVYVRAFRSLDRLEAPEAFAAWLRRIAVNETATVMAKELPLTFTDLEGPDEEPLQFPETRVDYQPELSLDRKETARLVREILETLPPEQQLIVGMYYYEGLTIKEISESLHLAPGTVKAQLSRGRKRVEAGVLELEQQGVKLYGLSPLLFLTALLRGMDPPAKIEQQVLTSVLTKTAEANGGAVTITAKTAGSGFLRTLAGKLVIGAAVLAMAGGGVLAYSLLRKSEAPRIGDVRPQPPTEEVAESGPTVTEAPPFEGALELIPDVLFDEAGLKVTPKDLDTQGDHTVTYTVENNTGKDLHLDFEDVAVNGRMVSGSGEIFGSGTETGVLYLNERDLDLYGIRTLEQISAVMVFTDSETKEEVYRSAPVTAKTNAWKGEPVFDESGRLVYDKYGIKIYTDRAEDNDGVSEPHLHMTIVNRSDQAVDVSELFANTEINRYVCATSFRGFSTVTPGNCGVVNVYVWGNYLEENHISFFNEVNMGFEIKKAGTWDYIDKTEVYNVWTNPDPFPDVPYDPEAATVLLDQNGITVVALGWERTYDGDFEMEYYIDNRSGEDLIMTFVDYRVNGSPITELATKYVDNNQRGFGDSSVLRRDLEEKGIDAISEISLRVCLCSQLDWHEYLTGEPVTVTIHEGE